MHGELVDDPKSGIQISFGYHCSYGESKGIDIPSGNMQRRRRSSSFSCLSGAALSANTTLANTNICNGLIGAEILPAWDSPNSFRRIPSSPSLSRLDILSSSLPSSLSNLSCSPSTPTELLDYDSFSLKSSALPRGDSYLNSTNVEAAGGAAGEDRVQTICSEETRSLFCAIYDGFNGRDAADFLAGTLYETVGYYLNLLDCELEHELLKASDLPGSDKTPQAIIQKDGVNGILTSKKCFSTDEFVDRSSHLEVERSCGLYKQRVLNSLECALVQAENDFLHMVEQEMEERPDLVSIGSCVLVALLLGKDLYVLNVGDSRAVLATYGEGSQVHDDKSLQALQLSDSHNVDNEEERNQLLSNHPDDQAVISCGKIKGKLKVTRALGVGYLKKKHMNDALMGILRVRNLISPPYVSVQPSLVAHEISDADQFVVLGSDGLFDFFSNYEVVKLVHSYISTNPFGDPAKFLVEQLLARAADCVGLSVDELMSIPAGRRRKYHDDVSVIVIILGMNKRTLKASTFL